MRRAAPGGGAPDDGWGGVTAPGGGAGFPTRMGGKRSRGCLVPQKSWRQMDTNGCLANHAGLLGGNPSWCVRACARLYVRVFVCAVLCVATCDFRNL